MDEPKVAHSAAELIAAATEASDKAKQDVVFWGLKFTIARASATDYARVKRTIANQIALGIEEGESELAEIAWVRACVVAPELSSWECSELRKASPADFSNLANLCRMVSRGEPLPLVMFNIWASQAADMYGEVEAGRMDPSVLRFWTTLVRGYAWWLQSDKGRNLDFRALGADLAGLEDGAGLEEAANALEEWAEREGVEAKNEQGAENSTSSAPASSGLEDTPTNSPSPDGPGET